MSRNILKFRANAPHPQQRLNPSSCLTWALDRINQRAGLVEGNSNSLAEEKMDFTPGGLDKITDIMKETVPGEKQIMQWIAAKPLPDQEQSVNLL